MAAGVHSKILRPTQEMHALRQQYSVSVPKIEVLPAVGGSVGWATMDRAAGEDTKIKYWTIENRVSGVDLGVYQGETAEAAFEARLRERGYSSVREAAEAEARSENFARCAEERLSADDIIDEQNAQLVFTELDEIELAARARGIETD